MKCLTKREILSHRIFLHKLPIHNTMNICFATTRSVRDDSYTDSYREWIE
jgi:hypothetical protein